MSATIHTLRTRTRPQALIEAPVDTRTPLMKRLDVIQEKSERPPLKPVGEQPRIDTDPTHWRTKRNRFLREMLRPNCGMCNGTGEITVDDGYGGVDFDMCPRCGFAEPSNADDFDPIPF